MIYHTIKNNKYQCLNNEVFIYPISIESRCLLAYMLTKPSDWKFYNEAICHEFGISGHKLARCFKELSDYGLVKRHRIQVSGRFEWVTEVYESLELAQSDNTTLQNSMSGNSMDSNSIHSEVPHILSTNSNKVLNKLNTDNNIRDTSMQKEVRKNEGLKFDSIDSLNSEELVIHLMGRFGTRTRQRIISDLEDMRLWLESNGKRKKDYKAFATNWIKKNEAEEILKTRRYSQYPVAGQVMGSI